MKRTSLQWIPLSVLGAIPSGGVAYHLADMSGRSEVIAMAMGVATIAAALVAFDDRLLRRGSTAPRSCFVNAARSFVVVQLAVVGVGFSVGGGGVPSGALRRIAEVLFESVTAIGVLGLHAGELVGSRVPIMLPGSRGAIVAYVATIAVGSIWTMVLVGVAALARVARRRSRS